MYRIKIIGDGLEYWLYYDPIYEWVPFTHRASAHKFETLAEAMQVQILVSKDFPWDEVSIVEDNITEG